MSGAASSSSGDTGRRTPSSSSSSSALGAGDMVCAFWLGARCYGLSTTLVGEVYAVDSVIPVPRAPASIVGLFSLRGAPVALVDTARALELGGADAPAAVDLAARGQRSLTALVIRRGTTPLAGLTVDRMDSVVGLDQARWTPRDWSAEHAAVSGFLEVQARGLVITLFDSQVVVERLQALRFR